MYRNIYNPTTKQSYSIKSKDGLGTLKSFIMKGGARKCGNCGGEGHNRRTCKNPKKSKKIKMTRRETTCKLCKGKGHNSRTCSQKSKTSSSPKVSHTPNVVKTFSLPPAKKTLLSLLGIVQVPGCSSGTTGREVYDVKKTGVLLAKIYDGRPVDNWWASEKWDGYRAVWNGNTFKSRAGKNFDVPDWYRSIMPPGVALDGELWLGRGEFESCGLLRRKKPTKPDEILEWENSWKVANVKYKVFDVLNNDDEFEQRMVLLNKIINKRNSCMSRLGLSDIKPVLEFTTQTLVSKPEALKLAKKVIAGGGEGIMLRQPKSLYEPKRSSTLYKIKEVADTEATIVGYKSGTGKYIGKLGSFICELKDDPSIRFNASGMDDSIRESYKSTHPIGTLITITYNGFSSRGVPRHPRYLRIRHSEEASS